MIRRIVQPLAPHRTDLAFALWFLNPLVIFVSGIHGQFDVIVVPFILLALILTNEKRYALSGVALTIATLFKLYPLFLFPLYLTLILKQSTTGKQKVISSAHFAVASLVTAILLTLPYLSSSNIWTAMFRRGDTLSLQGGFNVWFAAQSIKIEHWLTGTNASILVKIVPLAALAMIIMIPIAIMRQKLNLKTIIAGHLAIMIILFCYYSSLANPQYFLSVIAFLVIYVAVYNKYSLSLWIISIFGIAQYLLLATFAWKILLYPLAAYTPLLDVDDINRQLIGTPAQWIYWRNHPLVNPYIYSSGIGFFATTSVLIGCLKTISRQRSNNNHTSNHD
ncbi:MAG: GPI transamidase subunit PIG-U [bacterium ADurb.Bin400]|nr:MAG: GPI transamidase subunit PIG-U [bacterium ADurb.Bin400]